MYSPSLQQTGVIATSSINSHKRRSETPPPTQNLSKRAKRNNALVERFTEMTDKFTENREEEYRAQIHSHQRDMNFIIEAKTYTAEPLDDLGIDIINATSSAERSNGLRGGQGTAQVVELEAHPTAGRWSAKFVQEVNNTVEQRDAQLTVICDNFQTRLQSIHEEHEYRTAVIKEEHKHLSKIIRSRLLNAVSSRKARLTKDKDTLNITDINALLQKASQFSIVNPGSPGDVQSNRKTRHARHRLEMDNMGVSSDLHKGKRKAAENLSPEPAVHTLDAEATHPLRAAQAQLDGEQIPAPLYSMEALFSEKDRTFIYQRANRSVIEQLAATKRPKINGHTNDNNALGFNGIAIDAEDGTVISGMAIGTNGSDVENGNSPPTAPEMDREANKSSYGTRSTRNNPTASNPELAFLGGLAGRANAMLYYAEKRENKKDKDRTFAPKLLILSSEEIKHDVELMEAAINQELGRPSSANKRLMEDICAPKDALLANGLGTLSTLGATTANTNSANGSVLTSKQPSTHEGLPMSRTGSGMNGGSAMKRTASGRGNAGRKAKQ